MSIRTQIVPITLAVAALSMVSVAANAQVVGNDGAPLEQSAVAEHTTPGADATQAERVDNSAYASTDGAGWRGQLYRGWRHH